jgi:hypothetical protein
VDRRYGRCVHRDRPIRVGVVGAGFMCHQGLTN